jgi:uncharacterized membrane protein YgcG
MFIIMIILFETLIPAPYLACGGNVLIYDTVGAYILVLIYRITLSTFSIILGVGVLGSAGRLTWLIFTDDMVGDRFSASYKALQLTLTVTAGLGLIGQAIYFLIVTVTETTPPNYASLSILLALEWFPAILFIFVQPIRMPKNFIKTVTTVVTTGSTGKSGSKAGSSGKSDSGKPNSSGKSGGSHASGGVSLASPGRTASVPD